VAICSGLSGLGFDLKFIIDYKIGQKGSNI